MHGAVAFVVKGYPRLSETFIAQEILALEQLGLDIRIISLRHPTDKHVHPVHRAIRAPVHYLPEYLHHEPLRVIAGLVHAVCKTRFVAALRPWLQDLRRDFTRNRVRRFGQAAVLARELPDDVVQLHAHFLHTPASVTRYAALMKGMPWSCSAHAKDIWTITDWEKREKLEDCEWTVTCTATNSDHLQALAPDTGRVELLYHGLDFDRLPPAPAARRPRNASDAQDPVVVFSVGRLVEKKGYDDLLAALATLPPTLHWRFVHIGGGPLRETLEAQAESLGLSDRVSWLGALPQEAVFDHYAHADVFVLASRVARDGDRDGLPNVLMEAQSQGLACISTRVSGIPELVEHEVTGLLVGERDRPALAAALRRLLTDPILRERLGRAGERHVRDCFSLASGIDRLLEKFAQQPVFQSATRQVS